MVNRICDELDEGSGDSLATSKLKKFVNTAYKDVAKREGLEKAMDIVAVNNTLPLPADFYRVSKVYYDGDIIDYNEEENYISVDGFGSMKLFYFYIPADLGDNDTPLTNPGNDDSIINYAKYIYLQSDDQYGKAEVHNRDYNTQPIRRIHKAMEFKVVR
jgi:hypothetical protein